MSTATRKRSPSMKVTASALRHQRLRPDVGRTAAQPTRTTTWRRRSTAGAWRASRRGWAAGAGRGRRRHPKVRPDLGILTVGVVRPSPTRARTWKRAAEARAELARVVDAMIARAERAPRFRLADRATPLLGAFKLADDVLYSGVKS